jgi:hypothetical protein
MGVVDFKKAKSETRTRIISNAVQIAIESRNLSHQDVSYEMVSWLKARAIEIMGKRSKLSTGALSCELLRELHGDRKVRRRRPFSEQTEQIEHDLGLPVEDQRK